MRLSCTARLGFVAALVLAPLAAIAEAGTVHGIVTNGTTGKATAGIELVLIQLQGGMRDFLHSSLKLNQYKFNSGRCLAGGAVRHDAVNRSCLSDCRQRSQNERGDETQARSAREPHWALPSAGRVPRGRRTCASVT